MRKKLFLFAAAALLSLLILPVFFSRPVQGVSEVISITTNHDLYIPEYMYGDYVYHYPVDYFQYAVSSRNGGSFLTADPNMIFTIKFSDGKEDLVGTSREIYKKTGQNLTFTEQKSQSSEHWKCGGTYNVVVSYKDGTGILKVHITDSPVKSITPEREIYIYENTCGSWETDREGKSYFSYNTSSIVYSSSWDYSLRLLAPNDLKYTIKYKDGRPDLVGTAAEIAEATGYSPDFTSAGNRQLDEHWKVGNTYEYFVVYGCIGKVKYHIEKNPVQSISCNTDLHYVENTNCIFISNPDIGTYARYNTFYGSFDKNNIDYDILITPKVTFTIKYNDGRPDFTGTLEEIYEKTGYLAELEEIPNQKTQPWQPGNTYQIEVRYAGKKCNINITIDPLLEVTNLKAETAGKGKVKLTWTGSAGAEGYLIYGQKDGKYGYIGMTTSGTTFTDTKALADDYNYYWVFPYVTDSDGNKHCSGCAKYVYAKGVLTAVTDLKASSVKGGVKLTWNAVSGAEGYLVYGIVAGKPYGYVGMTTSGTTFTDRKASKTQYNYYWVFPYFKDSNGKMIVGQTAKYTYGRAI